MNELESIKQKLRSVSALFTAVCSITYTQYVTGDAAPTHLGERDILDRINALSEMKDSLINEITEHATNIAYDIRKMEP